MPDFGKQSFLPGVFRTALAKAGMLVAKKLSRNPFRTERFLVMSAKRMPFKRRSVGVLTIFSALLGIAFAILTVGMATAGDFTLDWAGTHDWSANSVGPDTFTLTDQYGFQLQARMGITRIGGTAFSGTPDNLTTFSSNTFGTEISIWLVWDANAGSSGIGESTNTATLEFLSGGSLLAVDALSFRVSDIDSTDANDTSDRCDFVTLSGNAGNPTLTYVSTAASSRSVRIGPLTGSGSTGPLAANQAQCIYNTGSTGSNVSDNDDFGSILATYPAGTHTATILYDESIENVYGTTSRNASARGIGIWAATAITVNQSISLAKSTPSSSYTTAGQTITYIYTITNTGPLPINSSQNIEIEDDLIGNFTCGTISSDIPPGGTHSCTADYIVTSGDMFAANITNNAVAGIGTGSQAFATRLQSNTAQAVVPKEEFLDLVTVKTLSSADPEPEEGDTVAFLITVTNNGPALATDVNLTDLLPAGLTATAGNGNASQGAYNDVTGVWAIGAMTNGTSATLILEGTVDAGQGGNTITNTTTEAAGDQTDLTTAGDDLSESVIIDNEADLVTVKSLISGDSTPAEGDTVTYLITVTNNGPAQTSNVSLTDLLPPGLTPTAGHGVASLGSYDGGTGIWDIAILNSGSFATLTLEGTVDSGEAGNTITNTTTAAVGDQTDPISSGDDLVESVIVDRYEMAVAKSADVADVGAAGVPINYSMTITNTGNADLTGLNVTDTLTQAASSTPLALSGPNGDGGAAGVLEVGETWTYSASHVVTQAEIDDGSDLVNRIDITTTQTGAAVATASAVTTMNSATLVLDVSKSADVPSVNAAGDIITYTITLTNTGTQTVKNINVTDPMVDISCSPGSGARPDDLAPSATASCTALYTVQQSDLDDNGGGDGMLDNTVTVTADGGILVTDGATVAINLNPALSVVKTVDNAINVGVGQTVNYSYVITNTGNQTISNVVLSELHNGSGPAPVPGNESLFSDAAPFGDSSDTSVDGIWDVIAPGDVVTFTGSYTITQIDVDQLQ